MTIALGGCRLSETTLPFLVEVRASTDSCFVYVAGHIVSQDEFSIIAQQAARTSKKALIKIDKRGPTPTCVRVIVTSLKTSGFSDIKID